MKKNLLFIFSADFDRRFILIFLGMILYYIYFFKFFSKGPWILIFAGLSVGLLSISLKQSFLNIFWSLCGSALGAAVFLAFSLIQSALIGGRTPPR